MFLIKPIWIVLCYIPLAIALYVAKRAWPWVDADTMGHGADYWFELIAPIVLALIALTLITGGCAGLAYWIESVIQDHTKHVWHEVWKGQMVSMRSSDGVSGALSGSIFMMSGYINSEMFYNYYTKNADGSFQPHKWEANDDTHIYEEDRDDGEVIQYGSELKNSWMNWFTTPNDRLRMDFHIPKGSLKKGFNLQ